MKDYKNELFKAIDISELPKIVKLEMKINILNFYVDGKFIDKSMYSQLLDKLKKEEQEFYIQAQNEQRNRFNTFRKTNREI